MKKLLIGMLLMMTYQAQAACFNTTVPGQWVFNIPGLQPIKAIVSQTGIITVAKNGNIIVPPSVKVEPQSKDSSVPFMYPYNVNRLWVSNSNWCEVRINLTFPSRFGPARIYNAVGTLDISSHTINGLVTQQNPGVVIPMAENGTYPDNIKNVLPLPVFTQAFSAVRVKPSYVIYQ